MLYTTFKWKHAISGVRVSPGNAKTIFRGGWKINHDLVAYSLSYTSAENYQNRLMDAKSVSFFWRHNVEQELTSDYGLMWILILLITVTCICFEYLVPKCLVAMCHFTLLLFENCEHLNQKLTDWLVYKHMKIRQNIYLCINSSHKFALWLKDYTQQFSHTLALLHHCNRPNLTKVHMNNLLTQNTRRTAAVTCSKLYTINKSATSMWHISIYNNWFANPTWM